MRNVILSLVVVAALIAGAVGGTLATWSDSETSHGNIVETGSVDLKVNGADDLPWGTGVPQKVNITCVTPCHWYGPFEVELWNAGQCRENSSIYMHLKNVTCWNVEPKLDPCTGLSTGYPAPQDPFYPDPPGYPTPSGNKTEPELVAEYGGYLTCGIWTDGLGAYGDNCSMLSSLMLAITSNETAPGEPGADLLFPINDLVHWECNKLPLGELAPCEPMTIYIWVKLDQDSEEMWGLDLIPEYGEEGFAGNLSVAMFNDWPSWRLMKDAVTFDLEFDLWLVHSDEPVIVTDLC
jgi:predicted ribosomally synthesized peptide with SipW-like signal peptide